MPARIVGEAAIIAQLRGIATHPAARSLDDDAAIWLPPLGRELVLTHDTIAAGVHYLPDDDPSDIAWKLVATNISDLAAKGAAPKAVLLGLTLSDEGEAWIARFAAGLARVLSEYDTALFGGDTVRAGASVFGCTAIGDVERGTALSRSGAAAGEDVYVTGTIGDAGLGLAAQKGDAPPDRFLQRRYRLPMPRVAVGRGLYHYGATAAMDVSDGLLIDARRLAEASGVGIHIDLGAVPLSDQASKRLAAGSEGRLAAATAGDDYELLFTAPSAAFDQLRALQESSGTQLTRIGQVVDKQGLLVTGSAGEPILPARLGFEH